MKHFSGNSAALYNHLSSLLDKEASAMDVLCVLAALGIGAPADDKPVMYEKQANIAYRTDKDADKERHLLDVYTPKGKKDFPTVLFVHGGSWKSGDKNLYAPLGQSLANDGIGCVICNYRLSPAVQHPGHIEDVAKAFAWTAENIAKYGGKKDQLFLCGHSAGGHLVALLATDPQYLKAEKHSPDEIKGVAAFSGVYQIFADEKLFDTAFPKNAKAREAASPITHVVGKHPPFLIAYADTDFPALDKMGDDMHAALTKVKSPSELIKCKDRNHYTIIIESVNNTDPLNKSFREFVQKNCK